MHSQKWSPVTYLLALSFLVVACLAVLLFGVAFANFDSNLPGTPIADGALDKVRAAACGQFCSTDGNTECSVTGGCPTDAEGLCVNSSASCGTCSGSKDITCQGTVGGNDLCFTYTTTCCTAPDKCTATSDGCICDTGVGAPIGTRTLCGIQYGGCGSGP